MQNISEGILTNDVYSSRKLGMVGIKMNICCEIKMESHKNMGRMFIATIESSLLKSSSEHSK